MDKLIAIAKELAQFGLKMALGVWALLVYGLAVQQYGEALANAVALLLVMTAVMARLAYLAFWRR